MNHRIFSIAAAIAASAILFSACKQTDTPKPEEQELITTARITFNSLSGSQTFVYKVQNGFNSSTPGSIRIDTIKLLPNTAYAMSMQILNESATPAEDITPEIVSEQNEHLFLHQSTPAGGAGSITFSDGSKDAAGQPFNATGTMTTGAAGSGQLDVYLMHAPTDKSGITPAASGGETDVHATYPVRIQ